MDLSCADRLLLPSFVCNQISSSYFINGEGPTADKLGGFKPLAHREWELTRGEGRRQLEVSRVIV